VPVTSPRFPVGHIPHVIERATLFDNIGLQIFLILQFYKFSYFYNFPGPAVKLADEKFTTPIIKLVIEVP
jgi:hypothetical protein